MARIRRRRLILTVLLLFFVGTVLGTPPSGAVTENFYSYRQDFDDDLGEYNNDGYERKIASARGDFNDEDDDSDSRYRGSDDWVAGSRRGWSTPSSSFAFNRIRPRPSRPPPSFQKVTAGWDEEEAHPWSPPPPRRKPSYVVKVRRPVKKDPVFVFLPPPPPAWIYFRPPNPGRHAPGWNRPTDAGSPLPSRRPPRPDKVSSWEEDPTAGSYPKDASYSFAYDAGDHERSEYADPWGTVRGSYSYIDPTGVRRTVHYTAGAGTGFKVLKSQPSNLIENVYRDPVVVRRKPSAFVYHLHPDGGWKPWEGRKESTIKEKPRTSVPLTTGEPEEELALDETRYEPQAPLQHRKHSEDPPRRRHHDHDLPRRSDVEEDTTVDIRGYEGGYGDRNPLVVVDDKKISPGKMMSQRMRRKKVDLDDDRLHHRAKQSSSKPQRQKPSN